MLDLLLKRYSSIDYLMNMDANDGLTLILKAIENDNRDMLYQKWLHDTARYEKSFNDYVKDHMPYRKSSIEEKEEILKKWGA